jgi:regulator of nonsense transcripts 1
MLHPDLDKERRHLAQFRSSMKKFTATGDNTFSVVNYSKPYTFGRLNNDIIVLLSSLGISNERMLAKQQEYFEWVAAATSDPTKAFDFLFSSGNGKLAKRVLTDGLDDAGVQREIKAVQLKELGGLQNRDDDEKFKSRMVILKSRRLFGVCDPYQVLQEGEVHIRITTGRTGQSTPVHGDVLVVRNPCLHPGNIHHFVIVFD